MRSLLLYLLLANPDARINVRKERLLFFVLIGLALIPSALIMWGFQLFSTQSQMDALKSVNTPDAQLQRADYFYYDESWLRFFDKRAADDRALESYEAVIDRFPHYENVDKAYLRAGDIYQSRKDYQKALALHTTGLEITRRRDFIYTVLRDHKLLDECCVSRNCNDSHQYFGCWDWVSAHRVKNNN